MDGHREGAEILLIMEADLRVGFAVTCSGKRKYVPTDEQLEWLRKNYRDKTNIELANTLGVSKTTLRSICIEHAVRPGKSYNVNDKRGKDYYARCGEARKRLIRSERRRVLFGIEQKTKLRVTKQLNKKCDYRSSLRRLGYVIGYGSSDVHITPETRRNMTKERNAVRLHGFRFVVDSTPLPDSFYDALVDELEAWARSVTECEDSYDSREVELVFDYGDGLGGYVRLEAELDCEWMDESFDHAFGTWDDPHPHYAPTAVSVACVYEVGATDAEGEDMAVSFDRERIEEIEVIL